MGVGFYKINQSWKIKVLEMKAIKDGLVSLLSCPLEAFSFIVVESDPIEVIASLRDIDLNLSELENLSCKVLELASKFEVCASPSVGVLAI